MNKVIKDKIAPKQRFSASVESFIIDNIKEEAATEETEESTESTEATANTEKKKPASAAFPTAVKPEAEKPKEKRFMDKFLGRK